MRGESSPSAFRDEVPMLLPLASLALGAVIVLVGAELLVRGASSLALGLRVPSVVVGLTIVAYGTSAPEAVVSVFASMRGASDLAVGNVLGSNVANLGLILGVAALVRPLAVDRAVLRADLPLLLVVTVVMGGLALDGVIARWEGALLLAGSLAYSAARALHARHLSRQAEASEPLSAKAVAIDLALVLAGLAGLAFGANSLVGGAVALARGLGVSELLIGATIVAIGTSLPELAASVAAARRGHDDLAVGNAVGSNLFNLLMVVGLAACIAPLGVTREALVWDGIPGLLLAVLVLTTSWRREALSRGHGAVLLAGFLGYLAMCVLRNAPGG